MIDRDGERFGQTQGKWEKQQRPSCLLAKKQQLLWEKKCTEPSWKYTCNMWFARQMMQMLNSESFICEVSLEVDMKWSCHIIHALWQKGSGSLHKWETTPYWREWFSASAAVHSIRSPAPLAIFPLFDTIERLQDHTSFLACFRYRSDAHNWF